MPRFVIQKHAATSLHNDFRLDARRNPVSTQPESVVTGRTIEQVREQEG